MDRNRVLTLLTDLSEGKVSTHEVYRELQDLPYKNLDFARLDSHRSLRQGAPEVIYCPGKTVEQIVSIACQLKINHAVVVATKVSAETAASVLAILPETSYHSQANMLTWGELPVANKSVGHVSIITAGTADLPIAEEASLYLNASGFFVTRINDVGVAGLHRLLDVLNELRTADVCIVIAGMDGALPSVVAGLVASPVIAVPTSVGYGANFEGLSALLTMLNSCAAGLTVVNIDNGFGAAAAALRILTTSYRIPAEA